MTDQTLTKEQILEHALGVNLFRTRDNSIVRVIDIDRDCDGDEIHLRDINYSYCYTVDFEGNYCTGVTGHEHDIVSLITADNLKQLFSQPQQSAPAPAPTPDIDFEQCIKDSTFLKTRDGSKVLLTRRNDTPNTTYPYAGVVIHASGLVTNTFWMASGKFNYSENELDIMGYWKNNNE
ncbi:TPA: hypothetical protein ACPDKP_000771 [Pasteurella multocida]